MPAINPVIELVKVPVPVPSLVFESVKVGPVTVLQQTPLAVTVPPPSLVTFPPLAEVVPVIDVTAIVAARTESSGAGIYAVSPCRQRTEKPILLSLSSLVKPVLL